MTTLADPRPLLALTSLALVLAAATSGCVIRVDDERNPPPAQITRPDGSGDTNDDGTDPGGDTDDSGGVTPGISSHLLWVLVHPSEAPDGPGIFLFDEDQQQVLAELPLPPGVTSPHALAYDGTSLWLGDMGMGASLHQLDPTTGAVISTIPGVRTEGITVDGDTLWYSGEDPGSFDMNLVHIQRDGTILGSLSVPVSVVQDVAHDGASLYYLVNDDQDRVLRVDPATGAESLLFDQPFVAPYSLAFDGQYLAVAADETIKRYDPATGAPVSSGPLGVPGWITAIAFADKAP